MEQCAEHVFLKVTVAFDEYDVTSNTDGGDIQLVSEPEVYKEDRVYRSWWPHKLQKQITINVRMLKIYIAYIKEDDTV